MGLRFIEPVRLALALSLLGPIAGYSSSSDLRISEHRIQDTSNFFWGVEHVDYAPGGLTYSVGFVHSNGDSVVNVYESAKRSLRFSIKLPGEIHDVVYSQDSKLIATASRLFADRFRIQIWSAEDGDLIATRKYDDVNLFGHHSLAFLVAHDALAIAGTDSGSEIWSFYKKGKRRLNTSASGIAGDNKGKKIALSLSAIEVYNYKKKKYTSDFGSDPNAIIYGLKDRRIAASRNGFIDIYNARNGKQTQKLSGFDGTPRSLAFTPRKPFIAVAISGDPVTVWNAKTGDLVASLNDDRTSPLNAFQTVAISPNGKIAMAGDIFDNLYIWDIATGELIDKIVFD